MSFMDQLKSGFDKAKESASDLVETTKIKHDISVLEGRRTALLGEIGKQVFALRAQGRAIPEVEAQCKEIDTIENDIKLKGEQIVKINTEKSTV